MTEVTIVQITGVDARSEAGVVFRAITLEGGHCKVALGREVAGSIERDLSLGDGPVYASVEADQIIA